MPEIEDKAFQRTLKLNSEDLIHVCQITTTVSNLVKMCFLPTIQKPYHRSVIAKYSGSNSDYNLCSVSSHVKMEMVPTLWVVVKVLCMIFGIK